MDNNEKQAEEKVNYKLSFAQLFNESFMKRYTKHEHIVDFLDKSPFEIHSLEDFEKIDSDAWDQYVAENSTFKSWEEMNGMAGAELVANQMKKAFKL